MADQVNEIRAIPPTSGPGTEGRPNGTQAITRAVAILRLLTRRGVEGCRLSELTRASGLPHPTVRRMLKCLTEERLVVQNGDTKRYQLGPLNFELGLATMHRASFARELRPRLERLAMLTGDTVYLNLRSGSEIFCLDRIDGHSQIRAVTLEIGGRRPLSFSSGGIAMLARMPDDEVEQLLAANEQDIENHARLTREGLRAAVERCREKGYATIQDTTVFGVSAVGASLPATQTRPMVAVSLAMVNTRMSPRRAQELWTILQRELLVPEGVIPADAVG